MTKVHIPAALRRKVRERAGLRCEYCLLAEADAFFAHEPDHVVAVKHGGVTDEANLALACFECNRHKGSDLASLDPTTRAMVPLYNPRIDAWPDHFEAKGGLVTATTAVGRATVALLHLNALARAEIREELSKQGRWPAAPKPEGACGPTYRPTS